MFGSTVKITDKDSDNFGKIGICVSNEPDNDGGYRIYMNGSNTSDDWNYFNRSRFEVIVPTTIITSIDLDYVRQGKAQAIKTLRDMCGTYGYGCLRLRLGDAKEFIEAVMSLNKNDDQSATIRDMNDMIDSLSRTNEDLFNRIGDLVAENDTLRSKLRTMYHSMDHDTLVELLLK